MRLTRADQHYNLLHVLARKLKEEGVARPGPIAERITPFLVDEIPNEAFEPKLSLDDGTVCYYAGGEIEEQPCTEMQELLYGAHLNLPKDKPITLSISSPGGGVYSGLAVYSTITELRRKGRRVNVHVSGVALSMAAIILQAGHKRTMEPHGFLLLHECHYGLPPMKSSAHEDELRFSKRLDSAMNAIFASRTGKPVKYYREMQARKDWYLSATEAYAEGLVDEILKVPAFPKKSK